tara:strand:- start:585 stop:1349 length:765 start_codon:yes stop_codon:yes gene_type:complete
MDTTQTEATTEFVSDDEGQADIIDQVVNEADGETMQAEEAVEQEIDWQGEAKKFQSMYDRTYAENGKLKQLEPLGQLLESRPDLVDLLQNNISGSQAKEQPSKPALPEEDFNPWEAYYKPGSQSYEFRKNQELDLTNQVVGQALQRQERQMAEKMTYNNTVNELRNTYKFSDDDVNNFMQFVTQPKEQVGLPNLVKLYRDVNKGGMVSDTAQAVTAARNAPRSPGAIQGAPPQTKSDIDKVWDSVMGVGDKTVF